MLFKELPVGATFEFKDYGTDTELKTRAPFTKTGEMKYQSTKSSWWCYCGENCEVTIS